jgi:beta-galactosidase
MFLNTEDGINRVAVRSTMAPGTITVSASRDELKPAMVTWTSKAVEVVDGLSQEAEVTLEPAAAK